MLDTPQIQRIDISSRASSEFWNVTPYPKYTLEEYLPTNTKGYTSLRELSFRFFDNDFFDRKNFVNQTASILEHLPQVERLTISGGAMIPEEAREDSAVRTLRSKLCDVGRKFSSLATLGIAAGLADMKLSTELEVVRPKTSHDCTLVWRKLRQREDQHGNSFYVPELESEEEMMF